MAKLSTLKAETTHRVVVYGGPKSGKTELVGKLSEKFNLIYFGLENGHATLFKLPLAQQERIEAILIPDSRVFPIAIETMLKVIRGSKVEICEEHGKVSCPLCKKDQKGFSTVELNALGPDTIVVVDSLTQLAVSAISHITSKMDDDYRYEWDDYRKQGTLMDKFLSQCQQAKFNLVCITHETETEQDDKTTRIVPVAGTTNFSRNTARYFDHVVHCQLKNKKHNFSSGSTNSATILTGSRTNVVIERMGEPSLIPLFSGELDEILRPEQEAVKAATPGVAAMSALKLKLGANK
jgi:hypothetical protein